MNIKNSNNNDSSNKGDKPTSKLTANELTWLFAHCFELIAYIKTKGHDIDDDIARAVLDQLFKILQKNGFEYIYRKEDRAKIRKGEITPTDEQKLTYIRRQLKQQISSYFRKAKALKRGYGMITSLDEQEYAQLEDLNSVDPSTFCEVKELHYRTIHKTKKLLTPENWNKFNERERIVINVAKRKGLTELKRSGIYKHLTSEELEAFLPKDGRPVIDEEKTIKTAIYKTIKSLPITAARILDES